MRVKKLIELLSKCDQDAEIVIVEASEIEDEFLLLTEERVEQIKCDEEHHKFEVYLFAENQVSVKKYSDQ